MNVEVNRRSLLKNLGAITIAITLPGVKARAGTVASRLPLKADRLATYISVNADGSVTGWIGKVDMGQGTEVGWAMMVAEELDLAPARVSIVQGHTDQTINMGGASGSTGIWKGGASMRAAAAEARRILLEMAAEKLGVGADDLTVEDGTVSAKSDASKKVTYGELIGGQHFDTELEWNKVIGSDLEVKGVGKPKSPKDYRIIGKPGIPRRDVASKVLGTIDYMVDVKVDGMLHGRMIRPPVAGAVPTAVDEASIAKIPGAKVVWDKGFIGVVAPREWDAIKASKALKVTWSDVKPPFPSTEKIYDHIRSAPVIKRDVDKEKGKIDEAFSKAAKVIEATYEWPFQSHASMAPACAVADVKTDSAHLWSGTQKPHYGRDGVAIMLGMPDDKVVCTSMVGPGSYGRNDSGDAAMDAAVLSKAVGKPVRVQGMRFEGHGWDPKAPASVQSTKIALDAQNNVIGWYFESKVFSKRDCFNNEGHPAHTLAGQLMGVPLKPTLIFGGPDEAYDFPAFQKISNIIPPLLDRASPLRTAHMRDPGGPQVHFAVESFMDEVAYGVGMDPLDFRLKYVGNPRDLAVIKAAAEKAGWQKHTSARKQVRGDVMVGQGISYASRGGTRVAMVADVEVSRSTGRVWVRKWTVAHDCGQIINPDLLKLTIEGNVCQSTSRALMEEVTFDNKMVTSLDWHGYPILDMKDAPETVDIILIDRPDMAPTGAGEGSSRPTAAAIANAIFDATGVRLRRAPLTPARIKAQMA
ncbi:MAG: molybdopterin binding aldehyde oxidase and xanthine dehydrogenase [Frankiales bacterium]|nr:molybdopterin binding aldehyde oxidase and xanthine dehydrogenase [Frankiales bacterium]